MIEANGITKYFDGKRVLHEVSFRLEPGVILGLLGPNGAGKTTTMRILTGFLHPDSGSIVYDGLPLSENPRAVKRRLGYLPEHAPLYPEFLVTEYLEFMAESREIPRGEKKIAIEHILSICSLEPFSYHPIYQLSKGYRQRVALAGTLIHDPDFIILDEPSSGLDPNQITEVRKLIRELGKEKTLILSTHILQEVMEVCDRVLILSKGRKVLDRLVGEIWKEDSVFLSSRSDPERVRAILEKGGIRNLRILKENSDGYKDYLMDPPPGGSSAVIQMICGQDLDVRAVYPHQRSLESIFLELTKGAEAEN